MDVKFCNKILKFKMQDSVTRGGAGLFLPQGYN